MTRSQCLSFLCLFVCLGLLLGRPPAAAQEGRDLPYNAGCFQSRARSTRAVDQQAAILFFSWIDWSATRGSLDPGESQKHTDTAGQALAAAIRAALPGYDSRKIHFAGHSHGAKVATVAALDIHPAGLSLFDSPETGTMACR